jgi:hypothetical protein
MQDWLNRLGLTLQFLAVWFVTPQIIGEDLMLKAGESLSASALTWSNRMKKIRNLTANLYTRTGVVIAVLVLIVYWLKRFSGLIHSLGKWMAIITALLWVLAGSAYLFALLAVPIMSGFSWLIRTSTRSAHALLIAGAILFTTGFAVLLAATWTHT